MIANEDFPSTAHLLLVNLVAFELAVNSDLEGLVERPDARNCDVDDGSVVVGDRVGGGARHSYRRYNLGTGGLAVGLLTEPDLLGPGDEDVPTWIVREDLIICVVVVRESLQLEDRCNTWRMVKAHLQVGRNECSWPALRRQEDQETKSVDRKSGLDGYLTLADVENSGGEQGSFQADSRSGDPAFNLRHGPSDMRVRLHLDLGSVFLVAQHNSTSILAMPTREILLHRCSTACVVSPQSHSRLGRNLPSLEINVKPCRDSFDSLLYITLNVGLLSFRDHLFQYS